MAKRYVPVEEKSYRVHFVILSTMMIGVTAWAVWDETYTRRPWKAFQVEGHKLEEAMAYGETLQLQAEFAKSGKKAKAEALKQQLDAEEARLKQPDVKAKISEAEQKLAALTVERKKTAELLTFAKSIGDEANYWYQRAKLSFQKAPEGGFERVGFEQERDARQDDLRVKELEAEKAQKIGDDAEKAEKDQKALIKGFYANRDKLKAAYDELNGDIDKSIKKQKKLEKFSSLFSPDIEQTIVPELEAVDRCQTCHTLVDKAGFETDKFGIFGEPSRGKPMPQPFRTHPKRKELLSKHPVDRFGCTSCHQGQGRAVASDMAHAVVTHQKHGKKWSEPLEFWEEPMFSTKDGSISAGCRKCHDALFEIPGADTLNQGKKLFVDLGCHGCHNTGLLDNLIKVGPELTGIAKKVKEEWLLRWLQAPKSFRPDTKMPNFKLPRDEAEAIVAFLVTTQTKDATDRAAEEAAKKAPAGKKGSSAPPAPAPESPAEGGDAPGMTAIPVAVRAPGEAPVYVQNSKAPAPGKEYTGQELVEQRGCLGCHTLGGKGVGFAPELNRVGEKVKSRDWIVRWITNPRSIDAKTAMPVMRLPAREVERIADYLFSLRTKDGGEISRAQSLAKDGTRVNRALAEKGRALVASYGCHGCHNLLGMEKEGKVGIELNAIGKKSVEQLDFGFVTDIPETWEHWIKRKVRNPRAFETNRIKLKMPVFDILTDDNIAKLVVWLRSLRADRMHPSFVHKLTPAQEAVEKGREVARRYNCAGCHILEDKGGDIRKLYGKELTMAPPDLHGEGKKVRSDWLFSFLKRPFVIRPWFQIRMPTFQMSDEEARTLAAYFAAYDKATYPFEYQVEPVVAESHFEVGGSIFNDGKCTQCHATGAAGLAAGGAPALAPNLSIAGKRLRADWIPEFVKDPQKLQPGVNMPQMWSYDEASKSYTSPFPNVLGGSTEAQLAALRDYMIYRLSNGEGKQPEKKPAPEPEQ